MFMQVFLHVHANVASMDGVPILHEYACQPCMEIHANLAWILMQPVLGISYKSLHGYSCKSCMDGFHAILALHCSFFWLAPLFHSLILQFTPLASTFSIYSSPVPRLSFDFSLTTLLNLSTPS
jgi:hypothetical protein